MEVEKVLPWEKVGNEKTVATSRHLSLVTQDFENPFTGEVEDFHRYVQPDWSMILAITSDGRVVTCRQYYQGVDLILQTIPGGNADFENEDPRDVAKRELAEETGYEAQEMIFLGIMPLSTRNSTTIASLFLALGCEEMIDAPLDECEFIETVYESLEGWILKSLTEIRDAPAREATYLALPWLRDRFGIDVHAILDLAFRKRMAKETAITSRSQ